ncbi:NAD(P)-dependent oxidoreductase [Salinivibrio proteolyticus]|uniref:NAD(P)-dependent oxidoreductase n=1 Tax=Salinivibrio proteolyticus TaxID=334715 RepID=UPI000988A5A2|nr:NAD(P)-dependent oxidoreductase [Salinivibrio proteolyticus]OOF31203.1 2-hydroxy-3-oxopropionate reductase [Salinivibrio proteolyticus]
MTTHTPSVAFIGLGVMGFPMAGHLQKNGFPTTVYNRTTAKAEHWSEQYQGAFGTTPAEAAAHADIVFMCVGNDDDVRSVVYGDIGVLANMKKGSVLVDHTTTSAELALELADVCGRQGIQFLDAPVSGGQAGAENGALTIMVGGEPSVFERVEPVMRAYAKASQYIGPHGSGQRCKMANQICIAGVLQGLSEAIAFAQSANLDIDKMISAIQHGAAGSWQMNNRAHTMADDQFDFGFAIDWMRKDLGFCLDEAAKLGVDLPLTQQVDQRYAQLQQRGFGRCDTSVLIKQFDSDTQSSQS